MNKTGICQCCMLLTSYRVKLVTKKGKIKTENLALAWLVDYGTPRYNFTSDFIEQAASGGKH